MNINQLEDFLKEYPKKRPKMNMLKAQLDCIDETGIGAINYSSEKSSPTYKVNQITEISAIKNIKNAKTNEEERQNLNMQIKILDSQIKIIESLLEMLREDQHKVITKYYFENKTYNEIAKEIYLTNKQIRNRRYSALNYMLEELNRLEKGHSKVI